MHDGMPVCLLERELVDFGVGRLKKTHMRQRERV